MKGKMDCETMYPEMYYRVQPFIMAACDQMDQWCYGMPMKDAMRQTSDEIYDAVCHMYPEMRAYDTMGAMAAGQAREDQDVSAKRYEGNGGRGIVRDILDIWLLNELFGRRRRW